MFKICAKSEISPCSLDLTSSSNHDHSRSAQDRCNSRDGWPQQIRIVASRSRSEQREVRQLERLHQGRRKLFKFQEYLEELARRCPFPQGESTRSQTASFDVEIGLAQQGASFVASANYRRCLLPGLEDCAGQKLEAPRDRSCGGAGSRCRLY